MMRQEKGGKVKPAILDFSLFTLRVTRHGLLFLAAGVGLIIDRHQLVNTDLGILLRG